MPFYYDRIARQEAKWEREIGKGSGKVRKPGLELGTSEAHWCTASVNTIKIFRARFTQQGKLPLEHHSIKVQIGGENSVCDLLTMHTLT